MTVTITKYRPDCTPIKQVFIDFDDDTLFDADEDEICDDWDVIFDDTDADPDDAMCAGTCPCSASQNKNVDDKHDTDDADSIRAELEKLRSEAVNELQTDLENLLSELGLDGYVIRIEKI